MRSTVRRVVVWFVALLLLVRLLNTDAVLEALLQFTTAGVLPLVQIALPPIMTVIVLSEIGVLVLLLLFRRELSAMALRQRAAAPVRHEEINQTPAVAFTIPGTPGLITRAFRYVAAHSPRQLQRFAQYAAPRVQLQIFRVLYAAEWMRVWLARQLRWVQRQLTNGLRVIHAHIRRMIRKYWPLVVTQLWRLDHFLEVQFKRSALGVWSNKKTQEIKRLTTVLRQEILLLKARITSKE